LATGEPRQPTSAPFTAHDTSSKLTLDPFTEKLNNTMPSCSKKVDGKGIKESAGEFLVNCRLLKIGSGIDDCCPMEEAIHRIW
jgi:hypothetical protein